MSDNVGKPVERDLDFFVLSKIVWKERTTVIGLTLIFMFLGLFIAFLTPNEFRATSIFIPLTTESGKPGGSLGGLASLAGINLNGISGGSEIPTALYPKIASSIPFKKSLLDATFRVEGIPNPVSYRFYYENIYSPGIPDLIKKYTLGLPGVLMSLFVNDEKKVSPSESNEIIDFSQEEFIHFKRLDKQLTIVPNIKEGYVTLSFVMPNAIMAAEMAKFAENLLQKEIIDFKVRNAKEQLRFTEERFEEKKVEFEVAQSRLSNFMDRNQNLSSAAVMNNLKKLEGEYSFTFNIYTELAKELEQAKLQVSKDTPVLAVIQPVNVPKEKASPNRPLILIVFTLIGLSFGIGYVFFVDYLNVLKIKWNQA